MITEDYCSVEVAKLLKEKGFNNDYPKGDCIQYACTLQMVMKWLREWKDIFIEVEYINQKACGCTIIVQSTGDLIAKWNWDRFQYANENPLTGNTYEEAVEAALKYSLENLI